MTRQGAARLIASVAVMVLSGGVVIEAAGAYHATTTTRPTTTTTRPTTTSTTTSTVAPATTSTTRPTTTTVTIADDDDEQPSQEPSIKPAAVSDKVIQPGAATAVSASFAAANDDDDPPPPPGTQVAVEVAPGSGGAPVFTATTTVRDDGTITLDVSVPEDAPTGVYMITVVLPSIEGRRPQVRVAFFVVKATLSAAGIDVGGGAAAPPLDPEVQAALARSHTPAVDAVIAEIQGQVRSAGENVVEAVASGAELTLDGARVLFDGVPLVAGPDADGSGRGLVAALGLGTAGAGLIVLRRRTSLAGAR